MESFVVARWGHRFGHHRIVESNVWTYPVVLGRGNRLFENIAKPGALRLVASKTSTTGVVMSRYVPAGDIVLGLVGETQPNAQN